MRSRRLAGAGLLALLCLVACQGKAPVIPILPMSVPDGVLRVGVASLPASTDPALTPAYDSGIARTAFEALLKPKPDLSDVQPAAAASYEVSAGGLTYTFHLRPAGRWSDGAAVKAQEFVGAWKRILDPRVNSPVAELFAQRLKNAAAYETLDPKKDADRIPAFLDGLGLKAADDRTFVVQLAGPAPDFKWIASVPAGAPARGDAPPAGSGPGPGNGPFRLDSLTKDRAVLLPNDHYWAGRPHLARVELSLQGEAAADLARFKQQQEELTSTSGAGAVAVSADGGLSRNLTRMPRLEELWAQFNVHKPPFDNPKVRLAFAQAIDRDALVRDLEGGAALPALGPVPKGLRDYRPELAAQRFDAAGARNTLDSSGEAPAALDGIHLLVRDLPADRALATFLVTQVKEHLGIQLVLDAQPSPNVTKLLANGGFQVQAPGGWLGDFPDERDWLDLFQTLNFSGQWSRYSSAGYDRLVQQADTQPELTRRLQLYAQAQQLLAQDAPVAFLYQPEAWNLRQPYVLGVTYTPLDDWPGDVYAGDISIAAH